MKEENFVTSVWVGCEHVSMRNQHHLVFEKLKSCKVNLERLFAHRLPCGSKKSCCRPFPAGHHHLAVLMFV
jgi:hypothetical protein